MKIPFNRAYLSGKEFEYIKQVWQKLHMAADGPFTRLCQDWLKTSLDAKLAVLTSSGTDALELASILCELGPGDEVIMPSYTFVSTANAFALRGAVPVFVDIRPDTLNIDETKIEAAITPKTKAIVAVHYAGVVCEMVSILAIAKKHDLFVIEDAAQAIGSLYRGKPAGSFGHFAAFSFHETKNISAGEGGALIVNDDRFVARAEIASQKGTDRKRFLEGQVDKYTWRDLGSSYMPSELIAAYLWGQLENIEEILKKRREIWMAYDRYFSDEKFKGIFERPSEPNHCRTNHHIYSLLTRDQKERNSLLKHLNAEGVQAIFHYIPLHLSEGGKKYARTAGPLPVTEDRASRILRLPLWIGMTAEEIEFVCEKVTSYYFSKAGAAASK